MRQSPSGWREVSVCNMEVLTNTAWNTIADYVLKQVKNKIAQPAQRKDNLGGIKPIRYKLNDTGNFSSTLQMEVLKQGKNDIRIVLTYPSTDPFLYQGKIYFETGRQPGRGVPPAKLKAWAERKVNGFLGWSEPRQKSFLYFTQLKIKNRGIGTFPVFDAEFISRLQDEYGKFLDTLTDEQIENLPGIEEVFRVFNNLLVFEQETIDAFR